MGLHLEGHRLTCERCVILRDAQERARRIEVRCADAETDVGIDTYTGERQAEDARLKLGMLIGDKHPRTLAVMRLLVDGWYIYRPMTTLNRKRMGALRMMRHEANEDVVRLMNTPHVCSDVA